MTRAPIKSFTTLCRTALIASALAACTSLAPRATLDAPSTPALPEGASGVTAKPGWAFTRYAVAAAHPLAARAGVEMLEAGGTAMDAAVAVQMVLALVEPQSSGIGGGAFMLHWDGAQVQAWDGRETAPAAAGEDLFLRSDGKPMALREAIASGRAVGVPGAVRMLEDAHRVHGRLPWSRLLQPAIALAEQGFAVSSRLHAMLSTERDLQSDAQAARYFYTADGAAHPVPHAVGHVLRNPALAAVLRAIAANGSAALHDGPIAQDIVRRVLAHAASAGTVSAADLANYRAVQRTPICTSWATWRVCGMPPPSSGHIAVMQILAIFDDAANPRTTLLDPLTHEMTHVDGLHRYTEASRLAFADRDLYVADPDFTAPPAARWTSLLDATYLHERAALIGAHSMQTAAPGRPPQAVATYAPQLQQHEHGTSHVSIVDAQGHAVALTTSIEAAWGSRLMSDGGTGLAGGFLLNNELTDFSFAPRDAQGRPVANRVQGGKRPRSSMSPTLVFERLPDGTQGRLVMTLGSAGGPLIIHAVAKTLIASLREGLDVQSALALPQAVSLNGPTLLERGRFDNATIAALQARGHSVVQFDLTAGTQAIARTPTGWFGGADPRREGVVMGR